MQLRVERVTDPKDTRLLTYSREHASEHDSSYLPGDDFAISADYPAYLLLDDERSVGAVVLIRSSRYLKVQRGRFSILHSILGSKQAYSMLLSAIRPHFKDLRSVYMFLPESQSTTATILADLNFRIERYSYVLQRTAPATAQGKIPDGYTLDHLVAEDKPGLTNFAAGLNASFSEEPGHIDSSADDIAAWFGASDYLEGGICLLKRDEEAIGTICVMRDNEDSQAADISALGVLAEHRGQGLGRALLRYAVAFAAGNGLHRVGLSVSAVNEAALSLYKSEGFVVSEAVSCHALDCA
jgi:mycothiol synthase